jgi:hypothetical protein
MIPAGSSSGLTGDSYEFGFPMSAVDIKHGNMGDSGTLGDGFLFIRDASMSPRSGVRAGWFIHTESLAVLLDVAVAALVLCGAALMWQRIMHAPSRAAP